MTALVEDPLARVARRFRGAGRFDYYFVAGKLRLDPLYADLLALPEPADFGNVLDIGCGRGQLGLLLLEAGRARAVLGLDWNPAQLRLGAAAATGLAFRTEQRDLAQAAGLPQADTVCLIDVLYQLDGETQATLLQQAAAAARSTLLIRVQDPDLGRRSRFARGMEALGRRLRWPNAGAHVHIQPVAAIAAVLAGGGFTLRRMPSYRGTPFANQLMIGVRHGINGIDI